MNLGSGAGYFSRYAEQKSKRDQSTERASKAIRFIITATAVRHRHRALLVAAAFVVFLCVSIITMNDRETETAPGERQRQLAKTRQKQKQGKSKSKARQIQKQQRRLGNEIEAHGGAHRVCGMGEWERGRSRYELCFGRRRECGKGWGET